MGKGQKEIIMIEINVTKKDIFNGKNAGLKAEDFLNQKLELIGMFTYSDEVLDKETGDLHESELVCLVTDAGAITSPSKTLVDSAKKLYESFEDEVVGLEVIITPAKSNAGRTFYRLELA